MIETLLPLAGLGMFVLMLAGVAGLSAYSTDTSSKDADLITRLRA